MAENQETQCLVVGARVEKGFETFGTPLIRSAKRLRQSDVKGLTSQEPERDRRINTFQLWTL